MSLPQNVEAHYFMVKYGVEVRDIFTFMIAALENDDMPFISEENKSILLEFENWHK